MSDILNETLETKLTRPSMNGKITLFHGSPVKLDKIEPKTVNVGTRLSKPRMSSFWTTDFNSAMRFGLGDVLSKNFPFKKYNTDFLYYFDIDTGCLNVRNDMKEEINKIISSHECYVYEISVDVSLVGRGHNRELNEYTLDIPIKPDKIHTIKGNQVKKYIKWVEPSKVDYFMNNRKEFYKKYDQSTLMDKLVYNDKKTTMNKRKELRKLREDNSPSEYDKIIKDFDDNIKTKFEKEGFLDEFCFGVNEITDSNLVLTKSYSYDELKSIFNKSTRNGSNVLKYHFDESDFDEKSLQFINDQDTFIICRSENDYVLYNKSSKELVYFNSKQKPFLMYDERITLNQWYKNNSYIDENVINESSDLSLQLIKKTRSRNTESYYDILLKDEKIGKIATSYYADIKAIGIGSFEIYEKYRNQGYGSKVLHQLINEKKKNCNLIYCYVDKENTDAVKFYDKFGGVISTKTNTKNQYYVELYIKPGFRLNEGVEPTSDEDMYYGLPNKKKYPLYDEKHVKLAVKFFNYVDEVDEKRLARAIFKRAKELNIELTVGPKNRLEKWIEYFDESVDNKPAELSEDTTIIKELPESQYKKITPENVSVDDAKPEAMNGVKEDLINDKIVQIKLDSIPRNLFITSDIHLFRDECKEETMSFIVSHINNQVKEDDTLLILGDVGYKRDPSLYDHTKELISRIKCKHLWLTLGNHDLLSIDDYYDIGFEKVAHRMDYVNGSKKISFTHYPVNGVDISVHGHLHLEDTDDYRGDIDFSKNTFINVYFYSNHGKIFTFSEYMKDNNINESYIFNNVDEKLRKKQIKAAREKYNKLINEYDFKHLKKGLSIVRFDIDEDRYIMGDIHKFQFLKWDLSRYTLRRDKGFTESDDYKINVEGKLVQLADKLSEDLRCKVEWDGFGSLYAYLYIFAPEGFHESSIAGIAANPCGPSTIDNKPDLSILSDFDYSLPTEGFLYDEMNHLIHQDNLHNYAESVLNVFNESNLLSSEDDREYNVDLWLEKDKNILFITGFTDKSRIVELTKQYNCYMRSLDDLKQEMIENNKIELKKNNYYIFYYNLYNYIQERYRGKRMIVYGTGIVFFDTKILKSEPVIIRERNLPEYILDCIKNDIGLNIIHEIMSYNQSKKYIEVFKKNMDKYNIYSDLKVALKHIKSGYLLYTNDEVSKLADKGKSYICRSDLSCQKIFFSYKGLMKFVEKHKEYTHFSLIAMDFFDDELDRNQKIDKEYKSINLNADVDELVKKSKTQIRRLREVNSYLAEASFNIDAEGTVIINMREKTDFMAKYNLSHKLIKIYKKAKNIEGLKHELCKLWFMYIIIEQYYVNPKYPSRNKKFIELQNEAINAKAFILNEFYQTLEFILENEKNFDFSKYFEQSPYYKDSIKITTDNVKGLKKMIQAIIG